MSDYHFVTKWKVKAPVAAVWAEINNPEEWPLWWRYVRKVDLLKAGNAEGVGSLRRFEWTSALPYRLAFDLETTVVDPFKRLEGQASGELEGVGIWTFQEEGEWTVLRYDWIVKTNKQWMIHLAPLLRPMFSWNHEKVMEVGRKGLGQRLNTRIEKIR